METKYSYIYKVTNLVNGKIYIGQSVNPIKRIKKHISSSNRTDLLFSRAIRKHGVDNFLFEVIRSEVPIDKINEIEIQCIKEHNCKTPNGYNLTDGGEGTKGFKKRTISEDTRKKMSESAKKRGINPCMLEAARLANLGKKRSDEIKTRISKTKNERMNDETRKKMSLAQMGNQKMKGKRLSEEHREKLRLSNIGKKMSDETKNKLRLSKLGKKHSEETKLKMKASHRKNKAPTAPVVPGKPK